MELPSVGLDVGVAPSLVSALDAAVAAGFDFVVAALAHPRLARHDARSVAAGRDGPCMRSDLLLPGTRWASSVVGACSPWIRLDADDSAGTSEEADRAAAAAAAATATAALAEELAWAAHLALPAVLLPAPAAYWGAPGAGAAATTSTSPSPSATPCATAPASQLVASYASRVGQALQTEGTHAWLPLPFSWPSGDGSGGNCVGPWALWDAVRLLTDHNPRLSLCLELVGDGDDEIIAGAAGGIDDGEEAALEAEHETQMARWLGEPVRAVVVPTRLFVRNRAGFPVLPPRLQRTVRRLHAAQAQFVLRGRAFLPEPAPAPATDAPATASSPAHTHRAYLQYLRHCVLVPPPEDNAAAGAALAFARPYRDMLQVPLQPLADHLASATYEVFERDPVKYTAYERACRLALAPGGALGARAAAAASGTGPRVVVAVVGAGRGPLVSCVLRAADALGLPRRALHVYALEKNPAAAVTLRCLRDDAEDEAEDAAAAPGSWRGRVTVVLGDVREVAAGVLATPAPSHVPATLSRMRERCHLLVSELLGSFGDNELSPECLDAAQLLLEPPFRDASFASGSLGAEPSRPLSGSGLSIPRSSTSFLAPVSSQRLWAEVRRTQAAMGSAGGGTGCGGGGPGQGHGCRWFETPFVVHMGNFAPLAPAQPVFRFQHPSAGFMAGAGASSNARAAVLRFACPSAALLHGFAGYFEADLGGPDVDADEDAAEGSGRVLLSINPATASRSAGMFSWFPIFFPLRDPVQVRSGEQIEARIWRRCGGGGAGGGSSGGGHFVWYEWCVTRPSLTHVHNLGGRSHRVGL